MRLSESQADRWHASDARAGLPVQAGGERSDSHAPCFNTLRDSSKTPETEPVSGTAPLPPQIWNLMPLGSENFPCWVVHDKCVCRHQLGVEKRREAFKSGRYGFKPRLFGLGNFLAFWKPQFPHL